MCATYANCQSKGEEIGSDIQNAMRKPTEKKGLKRWRFPATDPQIIIYCPQKWQAGVDFSKD